MGCTVFTMHLQRHVLSLLCVAVLMFSTISALSTPEQCIPSENDRSCKTSTVADVEARQAVRSTVVYSSAATVGTMSACHLASNHIQRSHPQTRCLVIGLGTGFITAAAHSRLTYTEDVWGLARESVGEWVTWRFW
ncbi:hypothetical protein DL95DRAFT_387964 [Leptodontidium sp. 2 PMI_412]|nr:hypothetical protein DL95DRAFT_387964 [Leptodontidium sp. 2 PMI_412]